MLHSLVKPQLMHRCGTCCGCDTSHLIFLSSPIRALGNAIQETVCRRSRSGCWRSRPIRPKAITDIFVNAGFWVRLWPFRSGYVGHRHIRGRVHSRKADPRNADRDSDRSNIHHYSLRKCGPCSFASLMAEARVLGPAGPAGSSPNWYVHRPF
jgi:hypothetical protein